MTDDGLGVLRLEVRGLGIILAGSAAYAIPSGTEFFEETLSRPDEVVKLFGSGRIVGFATGSPGTYVVSVFESKPKLTLGGGSAYLRLPFFSSDGFLLICDLYDFMEWSSVAGKQCLRLAECGAFHAHVFSRLPASGIVGDEQEISIWFERVVEIKGEPLPGIPYLNVGG